MIKEFKNGNITIDIKEDIKKGYYDLINDYWIENFYNNELTMQDYYFNQINGYMYLCNYRTQKMYDFSDCYINILTYLKEDLMNCDFNIKLYALPKKITKSLFEDLENGY